MDQQISIMAKPWTELRSYILMIPGGAVQGISIWKMQAMRFLYRLLLTIGNGTFYWFILELMHMGVDLISGADLTHYHILR